MSTDSTAHVPIRRPRMTPEREVELLTAALVALREVGYEALSMDLVAARAHCSKATLYRQWHSKPHLVAAALYATRPLPGEVIDTGSLRGDLLAVVEQLTAHAEEATALFSALAHALLTDQELATAVRTALIEPETANQIGIIDRAVARGELPHRPAAAQFLPQMLFSAVMNRPIFEGAVADLDYATRFLDHAILPALLNS